MYQDTKCYAIVKFNDRYICEVRHDPEDLTSALDIIEAFVGDYKLLFRVDDVSPNLFVPAINDALRRLRSGKTDISDLLNLS